MPPEQAVFRNYGFVVEIQGERVGSFLKVSGVGISNEVIEYREGGMPGNVRKLPGRAHVNDITLEHGVANSAALWTWLETSLQGRVERRNISIILLASDAQSEVARWNLTNCWLSESSVCDFDASGNDVLVERMTLVAEALEYRQGTGGA